MANKCANNIIKNDISQTPSKVGVLQSITFSHTPDEARSVRLAKGCVPSKIYSVIEKISFNIINQTELETYIHSFTIILSLFFIDLAFSVASFIVDAASFPILLVTVTYNRLSWLWLSVMQGCLVTLVGLLFILSHLILDIVPGGST